MATPDPLHDLLVDQHGDPIEGLLHTLRAWRAQALDWPVAGKFHSHVTVAVEDDAQIERLRLWCRERKLKLTVIALERGTRAQRDVMTTQHYRVEAPGAAAQILDALIAQCHALRQASMTPLRVKLEHESLPTLARFSPAQYREVHIKLRLPATSYQASLQALAALGQELGFVPSSNPNERGEDHVAHFVNMRLYEGTLAQADARIQGVLDALGERGYEIAQVKAETTLLDTHHALDAWWA